MQATASSQPRRVKILRAPSFSPKGLVNNITDLADYADLLLTLTVHRIKVRYKQSVLGWAWALIQPLALMTIYTVIFSVVAKIQTNGRAPYVVFVYAALLPWTFFSTAITNCTNGFLGHTQLITRVYFPREIIPLTYILAAIFDLAIASLVLAAMTIWYRIPLTAHAPFAFPAIAVDLLFTAGLGASAHGSPGSVSRRWTGDPADHAASDSTFATNSRGVSVERGAGALSGSLCTQSDGGNRGEFPAGRDRRSRAGLWELLVFCWGISWLVLFPLAYIFFKNREATMADLI